MAKGSLRKDTWKVPENKNRALTKKARGKGTLAMSESGMTLAQWTQNHDPLFGIKGIERHNRLKASRY
jgi:hypothetical protein